MAKFAFRLIHTKNKLFHFFCTPRNKVARSCLGISFDFFLAYCSRVRRPPLLQFPICSSVFSLFSSLCPIDCTPTTPIDRDEIAHRSHIRARDIPSGPQQWHTRTTTGREKKKLRLLSHVAVGKRKNRQHPSPGSRAAPGKPSRAGIKVNPFLFYINWKNTHTGREDGWLVGWLARYSDIPRLSARKNKKAREECKCEMRKNRIQVGCNTRPTDRTVRPGCFGSSSPLRGPRRQTTTGHRSPCCQ